MSLQAQGASSPSPSCFVRTESCLSWWVLSFSSAAKGRMGAGAPTSRRWSGDEDVETSRVSVLAPASKDGNAGSTAQSGVRVSLTATSITLSLTTPL